MRRSASWSSAVVTSAAVAVLACTSVTALSQVQRIVVGEDASLMTKALDRLSKPRGGDYGAREPAVFVGAARDLPLAEKWSPDYFVSALAQPLTGVKFSKTSSVFAYWGKSENSGSEKYAQILGHTSPYTTWQTLSMSAADLAAVAAKQESAEQPIAEDGYYYYSRDLSASEVSALAADYDLSQLCASVCPDRVDNVWWSTKGVTAQAHYDLINNLFVQIHGVKKFLIYPPASAQDLNLHPNSHPSARQSQAPILPKAEAEHLLTMENFPNISKAREAAIEVVLQPGDALYLPPYWIHHVIAENTTISYNVWWKDALSETRLEMQGHISHGLNSLLDMSWASKPEMMVALARAFVGEVIGQLFRADGETIAADLWEQRYQPLFSAGSPAAPKLGVMNPRLFCAPFGGSEAKLVEKSASLAALMATLPADVQMLEAGDLIDQLALWLHQFDFLPIAQLHDFARSLFKCKDGDGVGSRRSRSKRGSRKKTHSKKKDQSSAAA